MNTSIQFPYSQEICQQNYLQTNKLCIDNLDKFINQYKATYKLTVKCLSNLCRTRQLFLLQPKLYKNTEEEKYINERMLTKILFPQTNSENKFYLIDAGQSIDKIITVADEKHPCFGKTQILYQYQLLIINCQEEVELVFVFSDFYHKFDLKEINKQFLLQPQISYDITILGLKQFFIMESCVMYYEDESQFLEMNSQSLYEATLIEKLFIKCNQRTSMIDGSDFNPIFLKQIYAFKDQQMQRIDFNSSQEYNYWSDCFHFLSSNFLLYKKSHDYQEEPQNFYAKTPEELEQEIKLEKVEFEAKKLKCNSQSDSTPPSDYFVFTSSQSSIFVHYKEPKHSQIKLQHRNQALKHFFPLIKSIQNIMYSIDHFANLQICVETSDDQLKIQFQDNDNGDVVIDINKKCHQFQYFLKGSYQLKVYNNEIESNSRIIFQVAYSDYIYYDQDINNFEGYFFLIQVEKTTLQQYSEKMIMKEDQGRECKGFIYIIEDKRNSLIYLGKIQKNCNVLIQSSFLYQKSDMIRIFFYTFDRQIDFDSPIYMKQHFNCVIFEITQPFLYLDKSYFLMISNKLNIVTARNGIISYIDGESVENKSGSFFERNIDVKQKYPIEIVFSNQFFNSQVIFCFEHLTFMENIAISEFNQFTDNHKTYFYFWKDNNFFSNKFRISYQYLYYSEENQNKIIGINNFSYSDLHNKYKCDGIKQNNSQGILMHIPAIEDIYDHNQIDLEKIYDKQTLSIISVCMEYFFKIIKQEQYKYLLVNVQNPYENTLLYSYYDLEIYKNQTFLLKYNKHQANFFRVEMKEKRFIDKGWKFKITFIPIIIQQISIFQTFQMSNINQVIKLQIYPYQRYYIHFSNYTQILPLMKYWFESIEDNSDLILSNYDIEENKQNIQEGQLIYTENQYNYCFFKSINVDQQQYSFSISLIYDYMEAQNGKNLINKQRMFVIFDTREYLNQFFIINIKSQDLYLIPCFENISSVEYIERYKLDMKISHDIDDYIKLFDIIIHVNEIFRFSEQDLRIQTNQKNLSSVNLNKKCVWIEQKTINYQKGDEMNYFYLQNNDNLIMKLSDLVVLQIDDVLKRQKSNYFLINVIDFTENKILLIIRNSSLISFQSQIVIRLRFFSYGQYHNYNIFDYENIKQINIGNAQYIEVDILKDITQTSVVLVQNQFNAVVKYSQFIDVFRDQLVFIQRNIYSDYKIHIQDSKIYSQQQKQTIIYEKDLLISSEDIQTYDIKEVKYYQSNQVAGYVLKYLNQAQAKLYIDYMQIQSAQGISEEDKSGYEINQKRLYEFSFKVFNYILENDILNQLKEQYYAQNQLLEVIIVLSNNYFIFEREIRLQTAFPKVN
ncbi:hypothetical protein ABPG74_007260 [Tetrahymena malaccensis]